MHKCAARPNVTKTKFEDPVQSAKEEEHETESRLKLVD